MSNRKSSHETREAQARRQLRANLTTVEAERDAIAEDVAAWRRWAREVLGGPGCLRTDDEARQRVASLCAQSVTLQAEVDQLRQRVRDQDEVLANTRFYMDRSTLDRDVSPWLRAQWAAGRPQPTQDDAEREYLAADTAASSLRPPARYQLFVALRRELVEAGVCLDCGRTSPSGVCHCEDDR